MSRTTALIAALAATALSTPLIAQTRPGITAAAPVVPAQIEKMRDAALKDDVAYDIIEGITTEVGPRLAGTEAEARARTWSLAKLKALGFKNVRIETYQMPVWVRGEETAEVVSPFPQKMRLTALGNSGATPPEGLTAEIAYFPSFADLQAAPDGSLKGKIAFVSNAMVATQDGSSYGSYGVARFVGPNVAATKGAAAIVIRSIGSDHGRGPHAGLTTFAAGVTPIPAAALSTADADNLSRMIARGKPVTLKLVLTPQQTGTHESGNVIAEVPGSDPKAGIVLVGGHLDSWDLGTGAIDDGAGIAITAAAAKRFLDGPRPRRTIRVVWFGSEEVGGFGGRAYAEAHGSEKHATASESDFGADRVWRFEVNLPESAKPVGDRLAAALAPLGIVRGKGLGGDGSDVGPMMQKGVAAIDLNQSGQRYFDYHHTPEDTLDRIDPEQLRQNVAAWTAMLGIIANAPEEIGSVTPR
ncbi:M20/M25/M40 family metallo-hydrolase [Sphingomonas sp. So64.6b]|uniref:M20/M25/M40 family metallo-hydrolase n=1 Tax=Sphingomonas sp. So64.6b TaxID=2997354 RepID=UPI0016032DE0|nr:M20/M25/M40 family metallo-hydrolase [Sphingomonas sp. So64.6b]QNA86835.1 M20/M25/M40 family metallo-hydrolase [Sphingomonas sp. So64.6b]